VKTSSASRLSEGKRSGCSCRIVHRIKTRRTTCTGRSKNRDRGVRGWSPNKVHSGWVFVASLASEWGTHGEKIPYEAYGDPLKRFGRRETSDSSVSMGATCRIHALEVTLQMTMNREQASIGYSLAECWVADIDWTHLDREPQQVARRTTGHDLAQTKSSFRKRISPQY